jgi:hypothetical protein
LMPINVLVSGLAVVYSHEDHVWELHLATRAWQYRRHLHIVRETNDQLVMSVVCSAAGQRQKLGH